MQVLEGPCQSRKLWDQLNLNNSNETAVRIARGALSAICRAVGVPQPKDSCELHDLPLLVKVACKKRDDNDELANVIKAYKRRDAGVATPPPPMPAPGSPSTLPFSPAAAPRSSTPAPSPGGPPWKRN